MTNSYRPQVAQMNEEFPRESSLDFTLTQHPYDENLELQEVRSHFQVEPPWTWYYHISLNSHTLVILLQIDPIFGDEPEIVCKGFYKTKDTSIFAWSSIPNVGHYHWLRGSICQLLPNSKADYFVYTI